VTSSARLTLDSKTDVTALLVIGSIRLLGSLANRAKRPQPPPEAGRLERPAATAYMMSRARVLAE